LTVPGTGIATVVGPTAAASRTFLDAVSWVLGEQSAKTLRGTHMQDVIFAGTRDRKALGMAEVTITMVDPEAYEGPVAVEPEVVVEHEGPADWDEDEVRRRRAAEAEEIIANEQPGQVIEEDESGESQSTGESQATAEGPQAVVLKIRRRRFQRTPQKGEIVITAASSAPAKASTCSTASFAASATSRTSSWAPAWGPRATHHLGQEAHWPTAQLQPHDRRAIIEESRRHHPLQDPRSASLSCALKALARTWPASTTSSRKSRAR